MNIIFYLFIYSFLLNDECKKLWHWLRVLSVDPIGMFSEWAVGKEQRRTIAHENGFILFSHFFFFLTVLLKMKGISYVFQHVAVCD